MFGNFFRSLPSPDGSAGPDAAQPSRELPPRRSLHQRPQVRQQLPGPDQQRPGGDGPLRDAAPDLGGTRAPASRRRQSQPGVLDPDPAARHLLLGTPARAPRPHGQTMDQLSSRTSASTGLIKDYT